ncbi:hypothetical protein [endosymbiont of Acanthamoeba sp. UWC8]|uniref:hypothetical protein n=1 Tax=endosymbiont of Acanthamoeba sp. UWC8 TaxID=86106 RepID=UPI0011DCD2A4|nr:hypothetical protein [endosymbiont of Acanthamoeba sp. UWC8]
MRVGKNTCDSLIVINTIDSPLFKQIEIASEFIKSLEEQGFKNIALIAKNRNILKEYTNYFPKQKIIVGNQRKVEVAKNILKENMVNDIPKPAINILTPYIISIDQAKKFFDIKDLNKALLINSNVTFKEILTQLSFRSFCGVMTCFENNDVSIDKNVLSATAEAIKTDFTDINDRFVVTLIRPEHLNNSNNYPPIFPPSPAIKTNIPTYTVFRSKPFVFASASDVSVISQSYEKAFTAEQSNNDYFNSINKITPEFQAKLWERIEKYSIILGNIAKVSAMHKILLGLPNKADFQNVTKKYITAIVPVIKSSLLKIEEEKTLPYMAEAKLYLYLQNGLNKFYDLIYYLDREIHHLINNYTYDFAENFINLLSTTLAEFEKFSTIPSAEMFVNNMNLINLSSRLNTGQISSENPILSTEEEKEREMEDLGTDTEDEFEFDEKQKKDEFLESGKIPVITKNRERTWRMIVGIEDEPDISVPQEVLKKPKINTTKDNFSVNPISVRELLRQSKKSGDKIIERV